MNISHKQHYIYAALFWTLTGAILGFFGFKWIWLGFKPTTAGLWVFVCAAVGLLKGHFALARSARRSITRIQNLPERSPFYQVFSKGTWILILAMMGLGMLVRHLSIQKSYRGLVLATVGIALFWTSRHFWNAACKSQNP